MEADPLTKFTERDLVSITCAGGFKTVHMELHIDVGEAPGTPWATFLASSPHPREPTAQQLLSENFTAEERGWLEATIRPVSKHGQPTAPTRMTFLTANKP
jgi:hypothetical protein